MNWQTTSPTIRHGGTDVVIGEPEEILEEEDLSVTSFFWFVPYDEIRHMERGEVTYDFDFPSPRFVPSTMQSARRWFTTSPEAAGLRTRADHMVVVKVSNIPFDPELHGEEKAEGWLSADIRHTGEETELAGYIVEPFQATLKVTMKNLSFFKETKEWSAVEVGILSPEEVRSMAVCKVTEEQIYANDDMSSPVVGGVEDLRMGTYAKDTPCGTCGLKWDEDFLKSCPGHFGYISLEVPVPNWFYLGGSKNPSQQSPLLYALNHTCMHCQRIMLPDSKVEMLERYVFNVRSMDLLNTAGYDLIRAEVRTLMDEYHGVKSSDSRPKEYICPHCEEVSPQVSFALSAFSRYKHVFYPVNREYDDESDDVVTYPYEDVFRWLEDIPERDYAALGFSEGSVPSHMFFTDLPVAPVPARPPGMTPSGAYAPSDLSELYVAVLQVNNSIRRRRIELREDKAKRNEMSRNLFKAVAQLMTGQSSGIGSGGMKVGMAANGAMTPRNLRGVYDRIKGVGDQKNEMRRNVQSKVDEHVAYSVITPDPALQIDEIGVPYPVCFELTRRIEVTEENYDEMLSYVMNGDQEAISKGRKTNDFDLSLYPGAKRVIRANGTVSSLLEPERDFGESELDFALRQANFLDRKSSLQVGDFVERHLIPGDVVLFTRAPALHRQNLMAFRVVPVKSRSLSFNPSVCIPFNADFDGDAMRMYVLQSEEAIEEALETMRVETQMLHTRYGRTFLTFDQDEISGGYLLTFKNEPEAGTHPEERNGWGFDEDGYPILSKARVLNILQAAFSRDGKGSLTYRTRFPAAITTGRFKGCYRGRDIISMFLPPGINARYKNRTGQEIVIKNSVIGPGALDDKFFGTKAGLLAPAFIYRYGWEEGHRLLAQVTNEMSRVVFSAHVEYGFSLGIADISFIRPESKSDKEYFDLAEKGFKNQVDENGRPIRNLSPYVFIDDVMDMVERIIHDIDLKFEARDIEGIKDIDISFLNYVDEKGKEKTFGTLSIDKKEFVKDPIFAKENVVRAITGAFNDWVIAFIKANQKPTDAMNITLNSGGRGNPLQLRQMIGSLGQHQLNGPGRPKHGYSPRKVLSCSPDDMNPRDRGFIRTSYARGHDPDGYWFASTAGIRSTMESSQGGIAKSGYMEHKMKRNLEHLMVDDKRRVIDLRSGTIVSLSVGEDNLHTFHPRGPDNDDGLDFEIQPLLLDFDCKHGLSLYESCAKCSSGTPNLLPRGVLPDNIKAQVEKAVEGRELGEESKKGFRDSLRSYYNTCLVPIGEMIGSTGAANLGEPATQAGLRAFHGGGQGTVPTVDRLVQVLELVKKNQEQPQTTLFLKDEFNTQENAERLASFCTTVTFEEVMEKVEYNPEEFEIEITLNIERLELFDIDDEWARHTLKKVLESDGTRKVTFFESPIAKVRCREDARDLLIVRHMLGNIPLSGINDSQLAFAYDDGKGQYGVSIRGPIKGSDAVNIPKFWEDVVDFMGEYVDLSKTQFTDSWMVYNIYGLEASLNHLCESIYGQMNGMGGAKGIGELDYRYIRVMADYMGIYGEPIGLKKSGHMVKFNKSLLAALGGEDPMLALHGATVMGNYDTLKGPVEAIAAGKQLNIGAHYRRKTT